MPLHLWQTSKLADDLAADRLSERDALGYMLCGAVLYVQAMYWSLWFGAYRDWAFFLELAVVLAASLIGVYECYKANGGKEGSVFITRLAALAVPIGLKLAILSIVAGLAMYYAAPHVLSSTFRDPALVYRYLSFVMPVAFTFIYYWRIAHHIAYVRARSSDTSRAL